MAYPLIILGAGASFDYSSEGRGAPLTNQLVDRVWLDNPLLNKYKGAGALLSDIMLQVRKGRGFEEALTEFRAQTEHSLVMQSYFASLEFYLSGLFKKLSTVGNPAHNINNYKALINRIDTYCGGRALVITFNYDTLFERNVQSNTLEKMDDYINSDLKIVKLHGSHDWVYIYRKLGLSGLEENINSFEWYTKNPNFINEIQKGGTEPYHINELPSYKEIGKFISFPAIAVPLDEKNLYIPPKKHIQTMEKNISCVDRILIIGWKAGDPLLLETLQKHLSETVVKIFIVSGTSGGADKISETIKQWLSVKIHKSILPRGGGFSKFVADEASKTFFNE